MKTLILTLFPEMFPGTLGHSLAGKALAKGLWSFETLDIRDFALDKHKTVDDKTYGGGTGLVMKPDVMGAAIDAAIAKLPNARLIYPTPRGVPLSQPLAHELAGQDMIILCGRYEGVDQRILDEYQPLEVSLGDYILSGGEIAAQVLLDACIRLLPGVISKEEALDFESFSAFSHSPLAGESPSNSEAVGGIPSSPHASISTKGLVSAAPPQGGSEKTSGLLEYPQYTSPPSWKDREAPEILRSGNHQAIAKWRLQQAIAVTKSRRPDLFERYMKTTKE